MREAAPGDLILVRDRNEHGVARVDLARERHVTVFLWRTADRRWDKRRMRVERARVIAVLAEDADPVAIADTLNFLRNQRDVRKGTAERHYRDDVDALARTIAVRGGAR